MVVEFTCQESVSIKSFAVQKSNQIKLTTRFLSGEMLMFANLSLMSFIYDMLETFCFPDEKVQKILQKYMIEKVYIYYVLTNTDSTCLKFPFVSEPKSHIYKKLYRDIIFERIIASEIYNRFDTSQKYWKTCDAKKENLCKCLGYFEIEHIDNPCVLTIACNPKEHYEVFEDRDVNKKHKGIKKGWPSMNFKNFSKRMNSLTSFNTFKKPLADCKKDSRPIILDGEMQK